MVRLTVEDDGNGIPDAADWPSGSADIPGEGLPTEGADGATGAPARRNGPGLGGSIAVALVESLGATLHVTKPERGTVITIDFEPDR